MDWWVVLMSLETEFSLLSVADAFTQTRLLLALFPRRLWGSTGHILCLSAETEAADPPAGWARLLTGAGR